MLVRPRFIGVVTFYFSQHMIRAILLWVLLDSCQEIYPLGAPMIKCVALCTYTIVDNFNHFFCGPSKGFHAIFTCTQRFLYFQLLEIFIPLFQTFYLDLHYYDSYSFHCYLYIYRILLIFYLFLGILLGRWIILYLTIFEICSIFQWVVYCYSPQNFAYCITAFYPQNVCDKYTLMTLGNIVYLHNRIHLFSPAYPT